MNQLLRTPVTPVWLLLVVATAGSMWIAADHGVSDVAIATGVVMSVAIAKVWFVGMFFMELRHSPLVLKAAFNVWCLGCWAAILGVYLLH